MSNVFFPFHGRNRRRHSGAMLGIMLEGMAHARGLNYERLFHFIF